MIELTNSPIDSQRVLQHVAHDEAGGEVLFVGTTRRWTAAADFRQSGTSDPTAEGRLETEFLFYEAYSEMALAQLERLVHQARQRWPLRGVAIVHRLGKVLPQEASVVIAVSSPHRQAAFQAAQWLIDSIKLDVPIWKQEHYVDGPSRWVHPAQNANSSK
ncbi:MAG: molybdenum cofactor biosynthesis protein MoaE [Pirellulaceae bacterium]|nr:molybdenum cofactor biosynthesis protein MoaE [Pirellulaceae bacterium]